MTTRTAGLSPCLIIRAFPCFIAVLANENVINRSMSESPAAVAARLVSLRQSLDRLSASSRRQREHRQKASAAPAPLPGETAQMHCLHRSARQFGLAPR